MNTCPSGTPITPPPDFPVAWRHPDDAHRYWTRDREHMPDPITPMFQSMAEVMAVATRDLAAASYKEPVIRRLDQPINTYNYTSLTLFEGPPEEMAAHARSNRERVRAISDRLAEVWETEWRPALDEIWAFWRQFNLAHADLPALGDHLQASVAQGARLYHIHYLMGPPMWFAIDEFETLYCDLTPGATPLDAHGLLQGFDNKTLEMGRALWQLRDLARATPTVRQIFDRLPASQAYAALIADPPCAAFVNELHRFLADYGRRSSLWDWGYPSWEDDPTPVMVNLQNYIAQPDRNLDQELAQAAARRDALIAETRRRLIGYPQPVIERFETALRAAQIALTLTENHTYYIDFNGFGWIHRLIHELGQRLTAQGRLRRSADVFYLRFDELQAMIADPGLNHGEQAAQRRAESEHWAQYNEPLELGIRPAEPFHVDSPDARRVLRYVGHRVAQEPLPPPTADTLPGQAGSPGQVRGPARLILSLNDAHRLRPGDILVTTTTAPSWTPLFLTAAAVVTDAGGLLSHGAVVSREYHIPAVVGTGCATTRIADGQWIEVDGSRGVVKLISDDRRLL